MSFSDAADLVALVAAKALDERELQRVQPQLGCVIVARDVDLGRLQPVGHVEKEAEAVFAKDVGTSAFQQERRSITRRSASHG